MKIISSLKSRCLITKLPLLKSREVIGALERAGFIEHRTKGGHRIFKKDDLRVVAPVHFRDLKRGTVRSIIEQAGFTIEEFIKLLKNMVKFR